MDPAAPRHDQLELLVRGARALPLEQRRGFVERACGSDEALRAEVATLLGADQQPTHALIPEALRGEVSWATFAAQVGQRFGPYRVEREIGQGGMGAVYLAVRADDQYRKEVAIKLLRRGLETAEAVARFRDERQILAALDHPGIVRLLDGGSTSEGFPYLVMEYVEGVPITTYCTNHDLDIRARVRLFRQVCAAVEYAHQHLIVHRDLKPTNILVGADATPKLLDFGIAKLLDTDRPDRPDHPDRHALTRTGVQLLTPEYGSPEQARAEPITVATDVYSLGTILYEILTGARAHHFTTESVVEMLRAVCDRDPPPPSTVAPPSRRRALRGDLDNIVLKALQKEPARRYPSVEQLSEDLHRYLDGLPVSARAGTWSYRAEKFVRRRRGPLVVAALVAIALSTATAVSLEQARRAERHFTQTRQLANSLLFEVDETIRGLEGATTARGLIVDRALLYLDRLAEEAVDDPVLARELAVAYVKTADIQASPRMPNLGLPRQGLESYGKALAILERLTAEGHDDPVTRWTLTRALIESGTLFQVESELDAGRRALERAVALIEAAPHDTSYDFEVAITGYLGMFELALDAGAGDQAGANAGKVLALAERWLAQPSSPPAARYWLGIGHEMRGAVYGMAADPEAARHDFQAASTIFHRLLGAEPDSLVYRRELRVAHSRLADLYGGVGEDSIWAPNLDDPDAAERELRYQLQIAERLAASDPADQRAALELAASWASLGTFLAPHDPAAAVTLLERGRTAYSTMPTAARTSPYIQQFERFAHCSIAEPLAKLGHRDEALQAIATARGMFESEDQGSAASHDRRTATLQCRYQLARAQHAAGVGDPSPELAAVASGLRELIAEQPGSIQPYIGLVATLELLAELRPNDRCILAKEARDGWRSWPGNATSFSQRLASALEAEVIACKGPISHSAT